MLQTHVPLAERQGAAWVALFFVKCGRLDLDILLVSLVNNFEKIMRSSVKIEYRGQAWKAQTGAERPTDEIRGSGERKLLGFVPLGTKWRQGANLMIVVA